MNLRYGKWAFCAICVGLLGGYPSSSGLAEIQIVRDGNVITVRTGGQLFAEYQAEDEKKPYLWPIIGPHGLEMTRPFPVSRGQSASTDHPHHRSFWFAHGSVNGKDFWFGEKSSHRILHQEFVVVESHPEALIVTRNDWIADDGVKICSDLRALRFADHGKQRWIDFDITVYNDTEVPVIFGDTKEGTFAIRVADDLRVDKKQGSRIINAFEAVNDDAWGKPAPWVDYSGPLGPQKELAGIAVLNHPNSFRFPTHWHVRSYGLLAANCFGLRNFRNSRDENGSHTLSPGESFSLYFRVVLHLGDDRQARIPEAFVDYAKLNKTPVAEQVSVSSALMPSAESKVPAVVEQGSAAAPSSTSRE